MPFDRKRAQIIAEAFFEGDVRKCWVEPPYTPEGKRGGVHHYRLFCDPAWMPMLPRGEVYNADFTEAGWQSFSELHGEAGPLWRCRSAVAQGGVDMISEAALIELKQRQPCYKVAAKWVSLRKKGKGYVGPCPLHSKNPGAKDSTAFECNDTGWVCAFCEDGGDVIKLVQLRENVDFTGAISFLGGTTEPSPERAKQIEADQRKRREAADKEQNEWRAKAIASAQNIWQRGQPWRGTPVETYLRELRGLTTLPDDLDLRYAPQLVYCYGDEVDDLTGEKRARVIHRGPAMLAQIIDPPSGEFRAVHRTYLDLQQPKGKALIHDPETREQS